MPPPVQVADHPRIRGEHRLPRAGGLRDGGSSPHTRGARIVRTSVAFPMRIIPAYAGSTKKHGTPHPKRPDHPRIRGEHSISHCRHPRPIGSSPHTRGARHPATGSGLRPGIIPAYAGSTVCPSRSSNGRGDHPRIRGEHLAGLGRVIGGVGSSPHTRGAQASGSSCRPRPGIIPAYAGSTAI